MLWCLLLLVTECALAFDPLAYTKQSAACKAVRRSPTAQEEVDIRIRYVDINPGAKTTILMVHGWPSLWSTWSKQIEEFERDYRLVVPNLRGFGDSTHPGEMRTSGTMGDLVGDLACVLENAGVRQAICMGHDWGSAVCYEAARARPDIFIGVVGVVVPYLPAAGEHLEVKDLVSFLPKMAYQLFFNLKTEELAVLPPDAFLTSNSTFLGAWDGIEVPPVPFFSKEEEDYYVEEMSIQGFRNTLQFYTSENRHQSWKFAHEQGNHTLPQPVLAVYPTKDPVADWMVLQGVAKSADFITNLEVGFVEAAHWPHLESPDEFNAIVRQWLERYWGYKIQDRLWVGISDEL